ncbi:ATP synthase F1 subunit epsilon [Acetivibrio saccincola]|uniref:ATP synthase epsilon chain n=1 Tax=Acetivibrio saccincola TaxID=1677857 RepID=A0A2K9E5F9_9FIRM|nr:ATP synthase F1 subunit epsilon [Acetivibrio saccincola]AUG56696.1 ATP synthase epsilon chain [Acetivibrio saccincola]NLW26463.1 ATP synthase F1 subunit epsilon [Acetivibrio saccincola]PQQ66753.1 ATP synthase F1 subunit epsilon [Acetivibrio saccincola]HOA97826.1 ATP synthase F1 subunit epsilon [Acetivibrio saccincola]HQD29652.1 ATP synthase F1 subunit epsilon [Acetivibrio saccincola]
MKTFKLKILAADKPFYTGPCESLIVPTPQGKYGIMANHSNIIIAVIPGAVFYRVPGEEMKVAAVSHGFLKVENNEVLLLVSSAERPEEIDARRAKYSVQAAKQELLRSKSKQEYYAAQAHLARAMSRLRVKDKYDTLKNRVEE